MKGCVHTVTYIDFGCKVLFFEAYEHAFLDDNLIENFRILKDYLQS